MTILKGEESLGKHSNGEKEYLMQFFKVNVIQNLLKCSCQSYREVALRQNIFNRKL